MSYFLNYRRGLKQGVYLMLTAILTVSFGVMMFSEMSAVNKTIGAIMWIIVAAYMYHSGKSIMNALDRKARQ